MTGDEDSSATERIRAKTDDEDTPESVCATAAVTTEHVCVDVRVRNTVVQSAQRSFLSKSEDIRLKYCFGKSESHQYG